MGKGGISRRKIGAQLSYATNFTEVTVLLIKNIAPKRARQSGLLQ